MRGDIGRAIALCLQAREYVPDDNLALQFDTQITLGYACFLHGDYANASQTLSEAIRSGAAAGSIIYTVAASCILARLYAIQGQLHASYRIYEAAAQLIPEANGEHLGAKALIEVGKADVLCEWGDLDAALRHLQQGMALLHLWAKVDDSVLAQLTLARIRLAQADWLAAAQAVARAVQIVETSGVFSEARQAAQIAQVELWLAQGDVQAVQRWAASLEARAGAEDRLRFEDEGTHITQARAWIALHKPREALALLRRLEQAARSAGRMGRVLEILLLQALAMQAQGDLKEAIAALTGCLALAHPEGYVRLFLDEGKPVRALLARWLPGADASPLRDYAAHLLSQFDAGTEVVAAAPEKASPAGELVEPLSERELEVLRLMSLGRTNQQIAQQLVVARGTVKAHAAHIYHKLDVANRTEAVTRARQLGLLP